MKGQFAIIGRQRRMGIIASTLKEAKEKKKAVSLTKFKAEVGISLGISERKVMEYITQLQESSKIHLDEEKDVIKWI